MRLILLSLAALAPAAAAAPTSFDFLNRDADARAVGLAGAYTALASDANAMRYNPAGLGMIARHEAAFMSARGIGDQIHNELAFASRWGLGLSVRQHSFGDVPVTTLSHPDGTGGKEGLSGWSGAVGYGLRLSSAAAVGAAVKFVSQSVAGESASTAALDLGVLFRPAAIAGLSLGASVSNLGPSARYSAADERLPDTERLGAAYERPLGAQAVRVALDLVRRRDSGLTPAAGVEFELARALRARAGWDDAQDGGAGVSFGFGWTSKAFDVDYAAAPRGALGYEHWLSVRVRFGGAI